MRNASAALLAFSLLLSFGGCDDDDDTTPITADRGIGGTAGDADVGPLPDDGLTEDAGADAETDAGATELPCDTARSFGMTAAATVVADDGPQFAPRAVWTGSEWGVSWLEPTDEARINTVFFQRFDVEAAPIGDALALGPARVGHEVMFTGNGYAVAWHSARGTAGGVEGLRVARLDAAGAAIGDPIDLAQTFDVSRLSAAWAPFGGAMIVFTRSSGGVWAVALDEVGAPQIPQELQAGACAAPAVAYGDGVFGVAWLDQTSETPADLAFASLNELGQPFGAPRHVVNAGAQGNVHVAYGRGVFGVAWSKPDLDGVLKVFMTLFDNGGDMLATPPIPGPEGFGVVTDVTWMDPDVFAVAWQDTLDGKITVGITRARTTGQTTEPVRLVGRDGPQRGLAIGGNVSRAGVWFEDDPNAPPAGTSDAARVLFAPMGPCD